MKGFPSSDYSSLIKYWINMDSESSGARCYPSALMNSHSKQSRLSCTYRELYSYDTVVAKRIINKYGEKIIISSSVVYSPTTSKQLRLLSQYNSSENIIISSRVPIGLSISEAVAKEMIDTFLTMMVFYMQKYERARSPHGKHSAERKFNELKKDGKLLINFTRDVRRTNNFNSKLVKEMMIHDDSSVITEKISLFHKRELSKILLEKRIADSEILKTEEARIITKGGLSIDLLTIGIFNGIIKVSDIVRDSLFSTVGEIKIVKLRNKEYYKVKDSIVCKLKTDSLVNEMLAGVTQ